MAMSADKKAYLKHLAAAGDLMAQEALSQEATGRSGILNMGAPAAKSAGGVHADYRGDNASAAFPGAFTSPVVPRNLRVVMGAHWTGGAVTVIGTNQFGNAVTETFTGGTGVTRVGTKIFKTVTSATKAAAGVDADGTNVASIGTGDKIGILVDVLAGSAGILTVDGVSETVTIDATINAFTPSTAPDGGKVYILAVNI